ncbi:hypothetical protein RHGRI_016056 [Rhododendron griersonianum]|uniref:Uncharacterized protein n=1 Tax=Rhododendron griersonianum TaxID=479676 RepID=A0AAV6JS64_9ERIC|nr:hypothetical protein RHGRI_016056 [Rhododendron griersonianum]
MEQSDAGVFEAVDEFCLGRIGNCAFPTQSESAVAGLDAGFNYKFPDVPSSAYDQDFAFLGHWNSAGK